MTAWRSTVSWRLAFSIETTAWPARYSSSSSSSRVNGAPRRAIEIAPRYSGPSTSERSPIDSACDAARLRRHGTPRALRALVALERAEQLRPNVRPDHEDVRARPPRSPARARPRPSPPRSARTRRARAAARAPTSASQASTAWRTASATTPWRSRPVASASPTRRIVSSSSWRLRSTSSILASSCSDMSLNSRPSCANSSLPSTGTSCRKSPRESRRAAARKVAIWPVSARLTKVAEASASSDEQERGSRRSAGGCRRCAPRTAPPGAGSRAPRAARSARRATPRARGTHRRPHVDVACLLGGRQLDDRAAPLTVDGERAAAPEHRHVELGEALDPTRQRGRVGHRDASGPPTRCRRALTSSDPLQATAVSLPRRGQAPARRRPQLDRDHPASDELAACGARPRRCGPRTTARRRPESAATLLRAGRAAAAASR